MGRLSSQRARGLEPHRIMKALGTRVLAVAQTRREGGWCAYIDAVPGINHESEMTGVLSLGTKLPEEIARVLFPFEPFGDLPYKE